MLNRLSRMSSMLARDGFALVCAILLIVIIGFALVGPFFLSDHATKMQLTMRNASPGFDGGWLYIFGGDALGRSVLARVIVGARNTLMIAAAAVAISAIVGTLLGMISGYRGGSVDNIIMRLADIILSFPALLLALIIIYLLGPSGFNIIIVLAIAGIPIYLRTARAQVLEVRERLYVSAARSMGLSPWRIVVSHVLPALLPTTLTLATLEFSNVVLTESALSFLGLGIQPPDFTWGAMVAAGRSYLSSAWWISFWPGFFIMLTTLSLNVLSSWVRTAMDSQQSWRLETSVTS